MKKIVFFTMIIVIMMSGCRVENKDYLTMTAFDFFEAVSQIPRTSGNERAISDYLANFGRTLGLEVIQDDALNILIRKNGTTGRESELPVILQAHMDMVGEKNASSSHNFLEDPIRLIIQDDRVSADGTTLGADNAAGLAYIMAILASQDISHPPIEAIITTDEEAGMTGAVSFDVSLLKGRRLINLDSEDEGFFTVSSAASADVDIFVPIESITIPEGFDSYTLMIKGLIGGHSGVDINKGFANANILMGKLLRQLMGVGVYVNSINGGSLRNAIPRECVAVIFFAENDAQRIRTIISETTALFKSTYQHDNNLEITLELTQAPANAISVNSLQRVLDGIELTPNGVISMSPDIEGLVQTSNNLGVIITSSDKISLLSFPRSSSVEEKAQTIDRLRSLATSIGGEIFVYNENPAWPFQPYSPMRDKMVEAFISFYGKEPLIEAVHAGLECAVFAERMPDGEFISIGPDIRAAHSPDEWMSISSFNRVFEYLVKVLEEL